MAAVPANFAVVVVTGAAGANVNVVPLNETPDVAATAALRAAATLVEKSALDVWLSVCETSTEADSLAASVVPV
jgi:hypothetical protein